MTWLFFSSLCFAGAAENLFFEANKLYSNGEYAKAAEQYGAILNSGLESGHLHYNLGNVYFKLGKKGKALIEYERARKLIPSDEDLFANMNFVTSLLEEAQPQDKMSWPTRAFAQIRNTLPAGGWFILIVVLYYGISLACGVAILRRSLRKTAVGIASVTALVFLMCFVFFWNSVSSAHHSRYGIIVVPETEIRYSPSYSGAVAFKLHEGMRAQMVRQQDEWVQIRLTRDKNGWIDTSAIEEI